MEGINIGTPVSWTINSPSLTNKATDEWEGLVNDKLLRINEDSFIKGEVVYIEDGCAVIEVKDMSKSMFIFTLFHDEVRRRFSRYDGKINNPYQKYLCLDTPSMTSRFYYDFETGQLADAVYDDDGTFLFYDIDEFDEGTPELQNPDGYIPELIDIQLPKEDIESLEECYAFSESENMDIADAEDGVIIDATRADACSVPRAMSWFNTRDCAILTAWRGYKSRKTNDENNRQLQQQLRDYGYGVTKITGWFSEKNKDAARENSFLAVNLNEEESFRDNVFNLSERYEQDCFLYKKAGYDTPAVYVYTNNDYKKGSEAFAGRLHIGNLDAKAYSQIGSGRITFE